MIKHLLLVIIFVSSSCVNSVKSELSSDYIHYLLNSEHTGDSLYREYQEAKSLLLAHQFKNGDSLIRKTYELLGHFNNQVNNTDSAAFYFREAVNQIKDQVQNDYQKNLFYYLWKVYHKEGEYAACLKVSKEFLSKVDPTKDFYWMSVYYYFESTVYKSMGKAEKALDANRLLIEMLEKAGRQGRIPSALVDQAIMQYKFFNNLNEAEAIFENLLVKLNDYPDDYQSLITGEYANFLMFKKDYKGVLPYYKIGLANKKKMPEGARKNDVLAVSYNNIAELHLKLGDLRNAETYLDSMEMIGLGNIQKSIQQEYWRLKVGLSVLLDPSGELALNNLDSLFYQQDEQALINFNDRLAVVEDVNKNERLLQESRQEQQINELKYQSRTIIGIVTFLLVLAGVYFVYRQRQNVFETKSLQMQQRLLRTQMNPHFIFNTLYAIQNLIKTDQSAAGNYLVKFSRLLRLILENSSQNYVLLENEIESLRKYLDLQLLRFPDQISYQIEFVNMEEEDPVYIPPMLLQPIVENSVEHGFKNISYRGEILIRLSKESKVISCLISDNGIGASPEESKRTSSTKLINEFLKKVTGKKMLKINKSDNNPSASGLDVILDIPYKNNFND